MIFYNLRAMLFITIVEIYQIEQSFPKNSIILFKIYIVRSTDL